MVNEEILGALKSALERGESLKRAMMTLYNAGYKKEEISKAASSVNENNLEPQIQQPQTTQIPTPAQGLTSKFKKQSKQVSQYLPQQMAPAVQQPTQLQQPSQGITQRISGYGQPTKPPSKTLIIVLGLLLLLLAGILATIFLFKEELLGLFNNLFS